MTQTLNKRNKYFTGFFSLAITGFLLTGCGNDASRKEEAKSQPATAPVLELVKAEKGILASDLKIPGELTAFQNVDLYAKENSFVKTLYADVGSKVNTGQLLATLEAPELNQAIAEAKSKLKAQEAIYIASKANYDRLYETSKTPGTISPNDLDQALARKNADNSQLEAAKATFQQMIETLKYLEVRAPFSGIITARNISVGAYVGPSGKGSDQPLFTLQEQKKLRLVISVPEAYTGYLSGKTKISFMVNSRPNQQFVAQVKRLAGALDTKLRSEHIEMDVDNSNMQLLPGMVAEVKIPITPTDSTFIVPKSAVINSTELVFVIRAENNKAVWVPVKPGREADNKTEVFGKLSTADSIVLKASEEIRNGAPLPKTKMTVKS